jgi:tetratricopeptide (TPR) repeat protein
MVRWLLTLAVCAAVGALSLHAQVQPVSASYSGVSVEPNEQIFDTMCALDAAGFGADESTLGEMPGRLALRGDLLQLKGPATNALRQFYREHALADPGENLSRYIAFATMAGPPPKFDLKIDRELLPPAVLSIDGFQDVLADFYREANLDARWRRLFLEHQSALERYQKSVAQIVTVTNGYLREVVRPSRTLTFTVYVEPLIGNRTIASNTGDQYTIVAGSTSEIPVDDIRHAYLHFLLDPIALRNREAIEKKKDLLNIAARAPNLPVEYRSDFVALADECFIKAVELRLRRLSPKESEAAIEDDDLSGYILVRPLAEQLKVFEKSDPSMSYYFGDLIGGVDVAVEQKRLQGITFASAQAPAAHGETNASAGEQKNSPQSEIDLLLDQGDREIATQNAAAARATFEKVLKQNPNQPRAIYGLAIASVLSGDAPQAKNLFERLVSPAPESAATAPSSNPEDARSVDPTLVSWSHIYLGRIADLEGDRSAALAEYKAALGVDGAPESARVAAQRGVDMAYSARPAPSGDSAEKP